MATQYFADDITTLPLRISLRLMKGSVPAVVAFAFAIYIRLRGLLRWPFRPRFGVAAPGSGRIVDRDELPSRALGCWAPIIQPLNELGFRALRYSIADTIGHRVQVGAVLLDAAGTTVAALDWFSIPGINGFEERFAVGFSSFPSDELEILTSAVSKDQLILADTLAFDGEDTEFVSNEQPIRDVYDLHRTRIGGRHLDQMTPEAAFNEQRKRAARRFDWMVRRGLRRPMSQREIARVSKLRLE